MKQTPLSAAVRERLSGVNDLVWLQEFSLHEMDMVSTGFSKKVAGLHTKDIFGKNPYAARINIRLDRMPGFRRRLTEALLATVFAHSFELLNDYLREASRLLKEHGNSVWQSDLTRKAPEDRFEDSWNATGYPAITSELWKTFKYLRLRRNHYAHIAQILKPDFKALLVAQGVHLNQFWRDPSMMGAAAPLDFASPAIFAPTVPEVIAMLRVHLLWVVHFDPLVVAQLNQAKLLSEFAKNTWRTAGGRKFTKNDATVGRLARAIRSGFREATGVSPPASDIEKLIWSFRA